jgi:hypothetical protein
VPLQPLDRSDLCVDVRQRFAGQGITWRHDWPHSSADWTRRKLRQAPAFGNPPHEVHGVAASSVRQPSDFPRIA